MTNGSATIVQKRWNYCNVLRDDGVSDGVVTKRVSSIYFMSRRGH
jgi:type I restriction enzyme M protein